MISRSYINLSIGALSLAAVAFIAAASLTLRAALDTSASAYTQQMNTVTIGAVLFVAAAALWAHYRLNLVLSRLATAEMRATLVFDAIRDGVISSSSKGEIVSVNAAVEKLTGWRMGDLLGEHISILFPVDTEDVLPLNRILKEYGVMRPAQVVEVEVMRRDGSRFIAQLSVSAFEEDDGNIVSTIVVRDVTENVRRRAELEQRVLERTEELATKNEALGREIEQRERSEAARQETVNDLQEALARLKVLSGLLPICSHCKKIRDDSGYWNQIEVYVREHSHAEFSHGICPDCLAEHYPMVRSMEEKKRDEEEQEEFTEAPNYRGE